MRLVMKNKKYNEEKKNRESEMKMKEGRSGKVF